MEKTPTARPAGQRALLKLVNAHGGLLAVLEQPPGSHTLDYRCVFLRPEG
jgi:hypothetical protein